MKGTGLFFTFLFLIISLSARADSVALPGLTNVVFYVDHFLGSGKTALAGDIITMKRGTLKFRINGNEFDYSGNYSIFLTTPRKHKNPYLGLGSPETAKWLTLEDFFKGESESNATMLLPNATIWEKSDGFIDAEALGKEWILSGNYTITN